MLMIFVCSYMAKYLMAEMMPEATSFDLKLCGGYCVPGIDFVWASWPSWNQLRLVSYVKFCLFR